MLDPCFWIVWLLLKTMLLDMFIFLKGFWSCRFRICMCGCWDFMSIFIWCWTLLRKFSDLRIDNFTSKEKRNIFFFESKKWNFPPFLEKKNLEIGGILRHVNIFVVVVVVVVVGFKLKFPKRQKKSILFLEELEYSSSHLVWKHAKKINLHFC